MSNFNKEVGEFIKQQRLNKNPRVTQTMLARYLGETFQQVQKYEKGMNGLSLQKFLKTMEFFNCSITDVPFTHWLTRIPVVIEHKEQDHVESKEL